MPEPKRQPISLGVHRNAYSEQSPHTYRTQVISAKDYDQHLEFHHAHFATRKNPPTNPPEIDNSHSYEHNSVGRKTSEHGCGRQKRVLIASPQYLHTIWTTKREKVYRNTRKKSLRNPGQVAVCFLIRAKKPTRTVNPLHTLSTAQLNCMK